MRLARREEDHVAPLDGEAGLLSRSTQNALAPVAVHGVSQPLSGNEGNPGRAAFVRPHHTHANDGVIESHPTPEDPLELRSGLDGLHEGRLDSEPLTTLGAATSEDGAAALGGHTGTEAVALGTLPLIGLVGTLHDTNPPE